MKQRRQDGRQQKTRLAIKEDNGADGGRQDMITTSWEERNEEGEKMT